MRHRGLTAVFLVLLAVCGCAASQSSSQESPAVAAPTVPPTDGSSTYQQLKDRVRADFEVEKWLESAPEKCAATLDLEPCLDAPDAATRRDKRNCRLACKKSIESAKGTAFESALRSCISRVADTGARAVCSFGVNRVMNFELRDLAQQCVEACQVEAAQLVQEREAKAEEERRQEEERRREIERAVSTGAGQSVRCCDGTISPSCVCGGPRRGCCSHHGGICGCE